MTVTNNKKMPPYTKDIYMSQDQLEDDVLLSSMRMQWICTSERDGFDRTDPFKADFRISPSVNCDDFKRYTVYNIYYRL